MAPRKKSKDHILDVVENLCAEVGPMRVQHAAVAKALGIKPPSLYAHYPSMNAILAAATMRAMRAICETYEGLVEAGNPIDSLNESQSRLVDLLVERPGIARLVLHDFSTPGGAEITNWETPEIIEITQNEKTLFDRAVDQGLIEDLDFSVWYGARMGSVYVGLSYQWLFSRKLDKNRVEALKAALALQYKPKEVLKKDILEPDLPHE